MTAEQRSALESSLRAKLQQYRDINEQVDGWVKLDETDQEGNRVYPLILEYLPIADRLCDLNGQVSVMVRGQNRTMQLPKSNTPSSHRDGRR